MHPVPIGVRLIRIGADLPLKVIGEPIPIGIHDFVERVRPRAGNELHHLIRRHVHILIEPDGLIDAVDRILDADAGVQSVHLVGRVIAIYDLRRLVCSVRKHKHGLERDGVRSARRKSRVLYGVADVAASPPLEHAYRRRDAVSDALSPIWGNRQGRIGNIRSRKIHRGGRHKVIRIMVVRTYKHESVPLADDIVHPFAADFQRLVESEPYGTPIRVGIDGHSRPAVGRSRPFVILCIASALAPHLLAVVEAVAVRVLRSRIRPQRVFLRVRKAIAVRVAGSTVAAAAVLGVKVVFHFPAIRQTIIVGVWVRAGCAALVLVLVVKPVTIRVREDRGSPVVVFDIVGTPVAVRVCVAWRRPDLELLQV